MITLIRLFLYSKSLDDLGTIKSQSTDKERKRNTGYHDNVVKEKRIRKKKQKNKRTLIPLNQGSGINRGVRHHLLGSDEMRNEKTIKSSIKLSIWVSSSLIPPALGVLDAARTVETRDETREFGVAEPAVAEDERPVCFWGDRFFGSTGLPSPLGPYRGPRGVSERSPSTSTSWIGLGWWL